MKYTYCAEDGTNKTVVIPDDYINKSRREFGLTTKEAIDNYINNREIKPKNDATAPQKKQTRQRKPDENKRAIINMLFTFLSEQEEVSLEGVEVTNPERVIKFTHAGNAYELTLSKKRK